MKFDPRLWVYLDNLRLGYAPGTNLTEEQLAWARAEALSLGFACDALKPDRITRKGQIALRLDTTVSSGANSDRDDVAP